MEERERGRQRKDDWRPSSDRSDGRKHNTCTQQKQTSNTSRGEQVDTHSGGNSGSKERATWDLGLPLPFYLPSFLSLWCSLVFFFSVRPVQRQVREMLTGLVRMVLESLTSRLFFVVLPLSLSLSCTRALGILHIMLSLHLTSLPILHHAHLPIHKWVTNSISKLRKKKKKKICHVGRYYCESDGSRKMNWVYSRR